MFYDQIWWKRVFGRGPVEDIHWYIANLSKFLLSAEKWDGFLIKNWDLRSKNYWYGWEKPTVIPASLCSHPVTPKSCKRKSWTSAYAQKFKTNFKHSYYSLGIMLWIRCLRSIYKNKWQILETIACDLSPGVTPCSGLNRGVRSNGVPFSSFRYIKG